ncbi:MAG: DUF2178 domain-containing protein [Dehalococcoidales bacterium]|nr:DUF2178 domain-containing protein [Dehalococcoidales bacterium]
MSARVYQFWVIVIIFALAVLVGWSVAAEMPVILPLMGALAALVLIRLLRSKTREVMVDERIERINAKAAAISYRVFSIAAVTLGLILISFKNSLPPALSIVGETLAYAVCALMLIHLAFYYYYKGKL